MKAKKWPVSNDKSNVPSRKRRFRIDRLEERIAPKRGGKGTNNCPGTMNCTDGSAGSSY